MFKRLAVAASVSVLALMGTSSGASAAKPVEGEQVLKAVKVKAPKGNKAIDWHSPAPAPSDGGYSTLRIDWY